MEKGISKKLAGYKQQDKKNEIYGAAFFVTVPEVVAMFETVQGKCVYCTVPMKTEYVAKDKQQWTLDRMDNRMGHNRGNVVLSCLDCNLKRRNVCTSEKYRFTKQLSIVRVGKGKVERLDRQVSPWTTIVKQVV